MRNDYTHDLMINGYGNSAGGSFDKVTINGKGAVNGDVSCRHFQCSGTGSVNGNVKAEYLKISGNGKIDGFADIGIFTIEGRGSVGKDVAMKNMKISGKGVIGGNLSGEEIRIQGRAIIDGDCEVENFKSEGQFTMGGLLNADSVDIKLYGECRVKEIGGQSIKIKQKIFSMISLLKRIFPVRLVVETIEGDTIEIESTIANVVRGNDIIIGPNCEIDLVEYKGSYKQDTKAKVKEYRKI